MPFHTADKWPGRGEGKVYIYYTGIELNIKTFKAKEN
jgi:hypothetical protein